MFFDTNMMYYDMFLFGQRQSSSASTVSGGLARANLEFPHGSTNKAPWGDRPLVRRRRALTPQFPVCRCRTHTTGESI